MIQVTSVGADKNPKYRTDPGNNTKDKVFILSEDEVKRYLSTDLRRQCIPTEYAVAEGCERNQGNSWWWLRTPGNRSTHAVRVNAGGSLLVSGLSVASEGGIRPVLWIKAND